MTTQHIETLIIGAGQAGLSTGYHLQRRGRPFLIVDGTSGSATTGGSSGTRCGCTRPPSTTGCPGCPSPRRAGTSRRRTRSADYLERYALHLDLPVRMSTRVDRLAARPGGGYRRRPRTPTRSPATTWWWRRAPSGGRRTSRSSPADLDPSILQLHSSEYRRPAQLQPGPVLVVGASHSGTDIAYEVAQTHDTILCGRDCGQIPVRLESRRAHVVLPVIVFMFRHVLTRRTPIGRKEMDEVRFHGGPTLRVKREDLGGPGRAAADGAGQRRARRPPGARRRDRRRRRQRRVVHRLQAGLRLDRPADLR